MQTNQIQEISNNIKKFLSRESNTSNKIGNLEERINKIQGCFLRSEVGTDYQVEEKNAFNDFIRKGIKNDLITKSFSGEAEDGGVLITSILSNKIISSINAKSPMRQLASVESISTRILDIIVEKGEFVSGWIGETKEREVTDNPKLIKQTIHAHEIYAQPKATQAIIDDSEINIENWLIERLVDSFVKLENQAFISGDGKNKPLGLITNKEVEVLEEGQGINVNILLKLINKLDEGYLANASFLMSRKTLSAIQTLKDNTGRFIWQQSLSNPMQQTIFGIPVVIDSHIPDIEAGKLSIVFGDFKSA